MKISHHIQPLSLAAALTLAALVSPAQAQQTLPQAPSAVLAEQDDTHLARTPGSNFKFTAPSTQAGPGGRVENAQATPLALSLDDAIALGLDRNVRLAYDRANQRSERGYVDSVVNSLMPELKFKASTGTQEINLAAMGFKPSLIKTLLPPGVTLDTIVKISTTQAQVSASQSILNLTDLTLYHATKSETAVVDLNYLSSRGEVILATGIAYLQVLADQATIANAQAQEVSAKTLYSQASDKLSAGVGIKLDALRAQVQYQQRQQQTVAAQTQLAKDIIQLNRIIGLPAGQQLTLTDTAPLAEFDDFDLDKAKATAYAHRKDFLSLEAQIDVANRELRAVKYQRLPTLAFNGFYGVLGETTGLYHGVFAATGSLKFPLFNEGQQRGQEQQIAAQLIGLRQRESDLRVAVDAQIRASMLDVQSSAELVKVAQSSVDLAQQELSDEQDRFKAGVDDNLPVVDAQTSLVGAQSQLVQALYQFNVAKLQLARNTGVVETRYRTYLGK